MTDFALCHCGRWKAGQPRNFTSDVYVVCYDQTYNAYIIDKDELSEFEEWVATVWPGDNDEQGENESTRDFLKRIGIMICVMELMGNID